MLRSIVIGIFLIMCLSGCTTTQKSQGAQVQQLHSRIKYLEAELQRRDQEIGSLEYELEKQQDKRLSLDSQKDVGIIQMPKKQIQIALKNAGFYEGPIDGQIGPKTKKAIMAFQKENGLKPDGIAGEKTIARLRKYLTK